MVASALDGAHSTGQDPEPRDAHKLDEAALRAGLPRTSTAAAAPPRRRCASSRAASRTRRTGSASKAARRRPRARRPQEAARRSPALRARGGARVPGHEGARRHRRARPEGARPLRGRERHRHAVLRHEATSRGASSGTPPSPRSSATTSAPRSIASTSACSRRSTQVDYVKVGLGDYGKVGGYVARQVDRWSKQYEASRTSEIPAMEALMRFVREKTPASDETTLIHGDYRIDNIMYSEHEERGARRARDHRLGAVDARSSRERPRVRVHGLPPQSARSRRAGRHRRRGARHPHRAGDGRRLLHADRARARSPIGLISWPSASSASRPSRRASSSAASRATRAPTARAATAPR